MAINDTLILSIAVVQFNLGNYSYITLSSSLSIIQFGDLVMVVRNIFAYIIKYFNYNNNLNCSMVKNANYVERTNNIDDIYKSIKGFC